MPLPKEVRYLPLIAAPLLSQGCSQHRIESANPANARQEASLGNAIEAFTDEMRDAVWGTDGFMVFIEEASGEHEIRTLPTYGSDFQGEADDYPPMLHFRERAEQSPADLNTYATYEYGPHQRVVFWNDELVFADAEYSERTSDLSMEYCYAGVRRFTENRKGHTYSTWEVAHSDRRKTPNASPLMMTDVEGINPVDDECWSMRKRTWQGGEHPTEDEYVLTGEFVLESAEGCGNPWGNSPEANMLTLTDHRGTQTIEVPYGAEQHWEASIGDLCEEIQEYQPPSPFDASMMR